ncbi:MAG TPA: DUF6163 family protein [Rhizobiaceae bacterium]|nr:DUF6163 family protein [Rhizobiaceae bacterium]
MVMTARRREAGRVDTLYVLFLRVVALFLIVFAIQYWMRLLGVQEGADYRFDTMSEHWRLATSVFSVLLPVAALGLWGGYAWGVVLWLLAAAIEIGMHAWLTPLYGRADMLLGFHLSAMVVLVAFRLAMRFLDARP